jgi:MerR family transcriptional regulator, light-induced transcriptional regulator
MEDRSPRFRIGQLSARTGVPAERLRKWESRYGLLEPMRSPGGFRVYSPNDEQRVRLMERHLGRGYAAAEAAELAREGVVSPGPARLTPGVPERVVARSTGILRRALLEFDEGAAQRALDDLFGAYTVEAVLRDAVLPFLRQVGDAWDAGEASPGQEHFASTIIQARLLALTRGWGSGPGPRALLACPSGERHTLGLMAFGIALARRGWRITYLGEDTPASSLVHAATKVAPDLVVLAAVRRPWYVREADVLRDLAGRHTMLIAGAGGSERVADRLGAERLMADPVTAAAVLTARKKKRPAMTAGR